MPSLQAALINPPNAFNIPQTNVDPTRPLIELKFPSKLGVNYARIIIHVNCMLRVDTEITKFSPDKVRGIGFVLATCYGMLWHGNILYIYN